MPVAGAAANGKNLFAEDCQQSQDSAAQSPGGFDREQSQDPRPAIHITYAFHGFRNAKCAVDSQLCLLAWCAFGYANARDQRGREKIS